MKNVNVYPTKQKDIPKEMMCIEIMMSYPYWQVNKTHGRLLSWFLFKKKRLHLLNHENHL